MHRSVILMVLIFRGRREESAKDGNDAFEKYRYLNPVS